MQTAVKGLTNYVIRYISKYGNMTSLARGVPALVQRRKPQKPISFGVILVLRTSDGTVECENC